MGRKQRQLWEGMRRDVAQRRHCGAAIFGCPRLAWGIDVEDPVVCHMNDIQHIRPIPPPYEVWYHALQLEFTGEHECGPDCGVRQAGYDSGVGGLNIFERVKAAVRIEDVAYSLTDLYGHGTTLTGPCPFHQGTGREFVIWTDIQEWKCYGRCQMGGDVIHLIWACQKEGLEWALNGTETQLLEVLPKR